MFDLMIQEQLSLSSDNKWLIKDYRSNVSSFKEVCDIYKQTSSKQRVCLEKFGKEENLGISIFQGKLVVFKGITPAETEVIGSVNFQSLEILQSLLSVIYDNPSIGAVNALDLLLTK